MTANSALGLYLILWLVGLAMVVAALRRPGWGGVGLVLGYALSMWLIHWPAATIYLNPSFLEGDVDLVALGLEQSAWAIVAFAAGFVLFTPSLLQLSRFAGASARRVPEQTQLPVTYVLLGLAAYGAFSQLHAVPTLSAIVGTTRNLLVIGLALGCWNTMRRRRVGALACWLLGASMLPVLTIISQGYLGYGVFGLQAILLLLASFRRLRPRLLVPAVLLAYIALSFFVSYMRDRHAIREVVWGGDPLSARFAELYSTVTNLEWFDPDNLDHLARIDDRLNQNALVGSAVRHLGLRDEEFARGATLWDGFIALVPRALWPEKSVVAGSMGMVSKYTGIVFNNEVTSVGMGQVFEFYVNFGTAGVVVGFLVFGALIGFVDTKARQHLVSGDWQSFASWYLPGLALLQAGGSLVELTSGAAAAFVTAFLVDRLLLHRLRLWNTRTDLALQRASDGPAAG